ncbi:hypothetical protein [Brachyspira alvinipulli]|uniref:hypothetical protein n=1 Tax=Brachyspira alvinipulli TaxID=84379 RepID=UPI000486D588|nr:hypothetical protein [Brachyspira alvinipulli]
MYNTEDKLKQLEEDNKLYKNRISELNEIIGHINKENEKLKMDLNTKQQTLEKYKKFYTCKYTPYMVSDVIYENFFIKISSRTIVKTAAENKLFNDEVKAIRVPRKKGSNEKYASTVLFSITGIAPRLSFIASSAKLPAFEFFSISFAASETFLISFAASFASLEISSKALASLFVETILSSNAFAKLLIAFVKSVFTFAVSFINFETSSKPADKSSLFFESFSTALLELFIFVSKLLVSAFNVKSI